MIDEGSVSNISNVKNLLVWYITLSPESSEDEIVNLIMDAYTDQILAIDVYSYDYTKIGKISQIIWKIFRLDFCLI